ncbi:MAG TPA: helix-turn-helix transcriptional regulator [Synechococcales cyanobacterium M55_K2018_004]|nr:helix-turn-helix transcriptional regulator [Synechococcales cyanobacterium M55_K2018_004]
MILAKISNQIPGCINSNLLLAVVSEFVIKDIRYLVVVAEASQPEDEIAAALSTCLANLNILNFSEVDHFTLENQIFMIVEVQSCTDSAPVALAALLTGRELQIATLVAQGLPNKKIAKKLHISEWTVATHLRRIFAKLNVDSRAAMVYCCAPLIQDLQNITQV